MNKSSTNRNRTGRFECLEGRNPLAGNVTAAVVGGSLVLNGDSSSNAVQVRQLSDTNWEVRGLGTRINGSNNPFVAQNVVAGIDADLNRGDDFVKVFNGTVAADLLIETNQGNDSVQLINLNITGAATITTGDGNDAVLVSDVEVDNQGIGEEQATLAFRLNTSRGADVVVIDRLMASSAELMLGSGNDSLAMLRSSFDLDVRIRGSAGTDSVSLNDVDAGGDLWVHMGDGDFDALAVANSSATNGIFRGGTGDGDTLSLANNDFGTEIDNDFEYVV